MPKTAKRLWERVVSQENIYHAWLDAKRRKRLRPEVLSFGMELEMHLASIRAALKDGTWEPGAWTVFRVYEPKERIIHAPAFPDRIVHHALVRVVEPLFERRFIPDSFACRVGKGTLAASKRLREMLRNAPKGSYFLKADIAKYFPHIDHEILIRVVARTIGDKDVMALFRHIVCRPEFNGMGLPIGALTSQLLANVYLDQLDHYVKDSLSIHRYVRYMDDFIIVGDRQKLRTVKRLVGVWLRQNLKLEYNGKTGIAPVSHGIDFAGYRHWSTHVLPRKRTVKRARRTFRALSRKYRAGTATLNEVRSVVSSYAGYAMHCNSFRSAASTLNDLILCRGGE